MSAPMELYCWPGGWGLPSVDLDSLAVLTYARFTGAPLKVHKIANPWRSPSGTLPALKTGDSGVISRPHGIITHLRRQKYNADYDLSARQGADTLAFVSLLEEKLLPVLRRNLRRLQGLRGERDGRDEEEPEKELYREARECLTLLSQRLGRRQFFFGDSPASLDAFVFSHVALLLHVQLPSGKLQAHVRTLTNLTAFCTRILRLYFARDPGEFQPAAPAAPSGGEEPPFGRRGQVLAALVGLAAMAGYALLSGIVSVRRAAPARAPGPRPLALADDEDED
ncbi:metaxin-1 isoform X2 [Ornithorhynchus anatinus]|uniref:metaxin-1 isoform X2 n=1 Tax=Ornithorhynchus anatinus TaxID=9258 RepID=UPI0010A92145|nr:metaxin-1 isoform X2 [Ornithorhynchus anatinus]